MFPCICYVKVFFVQYFLFSCTQQYRPSFQCQNILFIKTSLINYLSGKIYSSSWNIIFVYSRYESSVTEYKSSLEETMKAVAERSQNKENKSSETTTCASAAATFLVNEVQFSLHCRHCLTLVNNICKVAWISFFLAPNRLNEFPFNVISKLIMAFLTGQSQRVVDGWGRGTRIWVLFCWWT